MSAEQAIRQHQAASLATIFVCPRLLRAYLYQRWKRPQAALQTAAPLLEQCQADHTPGLILQEGELAVPVLQLLARQEKYSAYASQLLQCLEPGQERTAQATDAETPADFHLTQREIEVLRLLAQGINNRAIAEKLVISLPTVKTHVAHILEKLHVSSRGEAAALAHQHRLHF